jgi:hypothetical protein
VQILRYPPSHTRSENECEFREVPNPWKSAARESTGTPPEIADYLPDAQTLREEVLIELIRVDLRHR